jgi:hypothetical protein
LYAVYSNCLRHRVNRLDSKYAVHGEENFTFVLHHILFLIIMAYGTVVTDGSRVITKRTSTVPGFPIDMFIKVSETVGSVLVERKLLEEMRPP